MTGLAIILVLITLGVIWLFKFAAGRNPTRPDGQPWEDRAADEHSHDERAEG